MAKKTIEDLDAGAIDGRLVLVRADFNVPLGARGRVADDTRLKRTLPTLKRLVSHGARVVLLSHLGRPGGAPDPRLSLKPVAKRLGVLMKMDVAFCPKTLGAAANKARSKLKKGGVLVLENTRFHAEETANDPAWSEALAEGAQVFVNDAFGTAHRAHASTEGVARAMRRAEGEAVAGLLMEHELRFLGEALDEAARPFVAVIGGAKISGKIDVLKGLVRRVDRLLIGGAMANTFLVARGLDVGDSLVEEDQVAVAREIMSVGQEKVILPVDVLVASEIVPGATTRVVATYEIQAGDRVGDIGPDSVELFAREIGSAGTVVWNGPMGVFEVDAFAGGTLTLAEAAAKAADDGCMVIVGGGDSIAAAEAAGVTNRLTHISTGGGASLELMAGAVLPGVAALSDREEEA